MSRYRITLTGEVEVEDANALADLLNNLSASAETDAEMTSVTVYSDELGDGSEA